jgi:arsenite methyltransferase
VTTRPLFDADASTRLEAVYRTPDVVAQRRATLRLVALQPGERVLDVGAGPGFLVAEMAEQVGPGGHVTGLEIADSMVALAQRRCAYEPIASRTTIVKGDATALPFPDASFDAAVSTQVYEYVADISRALGELHRVLRPGGRVLILDTDWDSVVWHAHDQARMQRIVAAWKERFADPHLPRTLARRLRAAGLEVRSREVLVLFNPDYDPDTYSVRNIRIMADFVVGRQGITSTEVQAWTRDLEQLGREGDYFFSLNRYLFAAEKLQPRR